MTTYVIHRNDADGNIVDIDYFDSRQCMVDELLNRCVDVIDVAGTYTFADGTSVDYGEHPCGAETDYDVHCASCGALMWRGLQYDSAVYGDDECEFTHPHPHEWLCTVHDRLVIAGTSEPATCGLTTESETVR